LERFIRKKDETAFVSLVRRQGPMVLGVCRRVLGNEHDAEDAFQATFLVLARKAASVRPRGQLANWLYGVAFRTALEARRAAARRRAREAKAVPRVEKNDSPDDLRDVLDEELARLPDQYREVVVLCELQGLGRKEAACQLGCPQGTVASRLSRARILLAKRLTRRGLAPSGSGLAPLLAADAASASVPPSLASATVKAASLVAAGQTTAAAVTSAQVTLLTERVVKTMFLMKLKTMTALVLLVGTLGGGAGWVYHQRATASDLEAQARTDTAAASPRQDGQAESPKTVEKLRQEISRLQDRVAVLEAEIKAKAAPVQEVLYQGKPASFWIRQLQDRAPKFRTEALIALGGIGEVDRSVIPIVVETMKERTDDAVRQQALTATLQIGNEAIPTVIAALKGCKSYAERYWLLRAIMSFKGAAKDAVPVLIPLLKAPDQQQRVDVTEALGAIGPDASAAVPYLIDLLTNKKSNDWWFVAPALGRIGPKAKAAVPVLVDMLKDQKPIFIDGIGDKIPAVTAAKVLGDIGPDAKAALSPLHEMLKKEQRRAAEEASPGRGARVQPWRPGQPLTLQQAVIYAISHIEPEAAPPQ
jgi:RNA polymerase sigma factor (sigma-70 family)